MHDQLFFRFLTVARCAFAPWLCGVFVHDQAIPEQFTKSDIKVIYKGKGDREKLENQRGITVSSSIGTIVEEIITNRLLQTIRFTQAQAGGRKG